jgi:hypothetical protein
LEWIDGWPTPWVGRGTGRPHPLSGQHLGPAPVTVLGTPIDLAKVDCDSFHITGYTDHITPWRAAHTSTQVLGGDKPETVVRIGGPGGS